MVEAASKTSGAGFELGANGKFRYKEAKKDAKGNLTYEYAKGVTKINNSYYYFNENGEMQTGLTEIDGKTYYLAETGDVGAVYIGFITVNGVNYYCEPDRGGEAKRID